MSKDSIQIGPRQWATGVLVGGACLAAFFSRESSNHSREASKSLPEIAAKADRAIDSNAKFWSASQLPDAIAVPDVLAREDTQVHNPAGFIFRREQRVGSAAPTSSRAVPQPVEARSAILSQSTPDSTGEDSSREALSESIIKLTVPSRHYVQQPSVQRLEETGTGVHPGTRATHARDALAAQSGPIRNQAERSEQRDPSKVALSNSNPVDGSTQVNLPDWAQSPSTLDQMIENSQHNASKTSTADRQFDWLRNGMLPVANSQQADQRVRSGTPDRDGMLSLPDRSLVRQTPAEVSPWDATEQLGFSNVTSDAPRIEAVNSVKNSKRIVWPDESLTADKPVADRSPSRNPRRIVQPGGSLSSHRHSPVGSDSRADRARHSELLPPPRASRPSVGDETDRKPYYIHQPGYSTGDSQR